MSKKPELSALYTARQLRRYRAVVKRKEAGTWPTGPVADARSARAQAALVADALSKGGGSEVK